ncbi:MAG: MBL fold metallo-hydrolase [Planctomycetota bacterium]
MVIQFWGVRGSIPTPCSTEFITSRYGGNTTCVSIRIPGQIVILDGGSGLRTLGLQLTKEMPFAATFFFSHVHWDHIQGVPFFIPAFINGNKFQLYGPDLKHNGASGYSMLEHALRAQQTDVNFPVALSNMAAKIQFSTLKEDQTVELKGTESTLRVTSGALNHPGGCFGYRIEAHRQGAVKTFVYATDTEHLVGNNPKLQKLAKNADVLLYDAQYTEDEYAGRDGISHKNWGHSTWRHGVLEAQAANVKRLLLTHHDPLHDDWAVARIEYDAHKEGLKTDLVVSAAREGMKLVL